MEQKVNLQETFYPYLQLIKRRKWIIIFSAIPVLIAGFIYCLVTPLTYKSSALIVIVPQKVPESYVRSTVTGRNDERIRGILQEIKSRTNLEKMIKKFNLYPELRQSLPMESVVERMRQHISIENPRGAGRNAFLLSFEGRDPKLITEVANALANMFVEQNLKLRESQSQNTATFLATQLEKVYNELKKREEILKRYKLAHMGELPEQYESNLTTYNSLQQRLQDIQESIRRAEDRRLLLRQQLADQQNSFGLSTENKGQKLSSNLSLTELKRRLKVLRSRYTENHPDIIALKRSIAQQEKLLTNEKLNNKNGSNETILTGDPAVDALKLQLKSTELELKELKRAKRKVENAIFIYQKRIENTPKREQELIDLTRDYENLKKTYNDLLRKKLQAEQAAALERRQQGEQFKIVDPARVPQRPIKPNLKKILPLIFILAFGVGGGLAFIIDLLSNKYFDPDEVKKDYQLEILACIPILLSDEEIKKRRIKTIFLSFTALCGYGIAAFLFLLLYFKGPGSYTGLI